MLFAIFIVHYHVLMNTAKLNGVNIAFEDVGSGPVVLFLHGFPINGRMWSPVIPHLSDAYRLIIPDLRGMGESEATAATSPPTSMADYADDAAALLDHLDIHEPVVVVGLSMGGYVVFEFHRLHPTRVRALGLIDTRSEGDSPEAAKGRAEQAKRVLAEGSHVVADAMKDKIFGPQVDPALKETWHRVMAGTSPQGVAAALEALRNRADFTPTLGQIDVPTLIVVGEQDVITPPAGAKAMHAAIRGSKLEVIPGAGHVPTLEQPAAFGRVMRQFLDGLKA